jgi:hypothetical protein
MTTYRMRDTSPRTVAARPTPELDLMAGDRRYGWIAGDRVAFVGFRDHLAAVQAAWVAHRTLMRRLARAPASAETTDGRRTFALARSGADEVIFANGEPIAVLVRPSADLPTDSDSFGFEIRLPGHPDEISVRGTAYRIYLALRSSGIAWTPRRANSEPVVGERDTRSPLADQFVAAAGDTTTIENGATGDDVDRSHPRGPRFLQPQWSRRRRTRTSEAALRRVRRLRNR